MSVITSVFSFLIKLVAWVFKKIGILGILIIILVIEIPSVAIVYDENSTEYKWEDNYKLEKISRFEPIEDTTASRFAENGIVFSEYNKYYLITLQISNNYSDPLEFLRLEARNQEGTYLYLHQLYYYGEIETNLFDTDMYNMIPAGVTKNVQYVLEMSSEEAKETKSITISERTGSDEEKNEERELTFDFKEE